MQPTTTTNVTDAIQVPIPDQIPITILDSEKCLETFNVDDPNLVAFAQPHDHDNPKDWSTSRKWTVTSVMSATAFLRITSSTIMAPALDVIAADLNMSYVEAQMSLSVYLLASAFGPLVLSPLSELYGRKVVLHASNVWFLVWNLVCGFSRNRSELIAARCLAGFGGSVAYALGSAVMGDIWHPEERGRSLGLYLCIPVLGVAIGPICGGYIAEYISWPWVFYVLSIAQAVMVFTSFFTFRETHAPTILLRRARHLRKTTTNMLLYTATEKLDAGRSVAQVIKRGMTRPLRLLAFHPLIQLVSIVQAFHYGVLYLFISSYATYWTQNQHLTPSTAGLHYLSAALGEALASVLGGPALDYAFKYLKKRHSTWEPEYRLPLLFPSALIGPAGLLLYGWAAERELHWAVVDAGVFIYCVGMQLSGQALQAYVIDAYGEHVGSATAASQFLRSLTAFGFPLFAPALFAGLGYGWGNTVLGVGSLVVGVPIPFCLWVWGKGLRWRGGGSH